MVGYRKQSDNIGRHLYPGPPLYVSLPAPSIVSPQNVTALSLSLSLSAAFQLESCQWRRPDRQTDRRAHHTHLLNMLRPYPPPPSLLQLPIYLPSCAAVTYVVGPLRRPLRSCMSPIFRMTKRAIVDFLPGHPLWQPELELELESESEPEQQSLVDTT